MIKLQSLLLESNWPEFILDDKHTWYHGRVVDSEIFSYDYLGGRDAFNQEGPGFYFTNSFENAKRYASPNGVILKCKINYKKLIIKSPISNTKANKKIIVDLIQKSPDKDYTLENFDENPKIAFVKAVNSYLTYEIACDAYQTLANDFYKHNAKEYLLTLSKYYDAQLTTLENTYYKQTIYHLIVYTPNIINVIDKFKI